MKKSQLTRMVSKSRELKDQTLRFEQALQIAGELDTLMPDTHRDRYKLNQIMHRMHVTGGISPDELVWLKLALESLFN